MPRRPIAAGGDGAHNLRQVRRRLLAVVVLLVMAFGAIVARLADLQVLQAHTWVAIGTEQRTGARTLPAARGTIYDRNGQALALSVSQTTFYADPKLIAHPRDVAAELAPILGLSRTELERKLTADSRFQFLARTVPDDVAEKVKALNLAGIGSYDEFKRFEPGGTVGRSLVGSVQADGTLGISGLERQYDRQLTGTPGKLEFEQAHGGGTIAGGRRKVTPAQQGQSLYLTIDQSMQYEAERALEDQVKATGAKGGMAIVSRPSTGEVLAMANVAADDDGKVAPTADNKALTSVFEPGSVNKIVTMSAALQEGVVKPDTVLTVPSWKQVADHTFKDAHPHPTYPWSATDILATSSNVGTISIAQSLGEQRLQHYLDEFGLTSATGLDFPGESAGLMSQWSGTSIGSVPIGQGISVTATQVLAALNVVANDGTYVAPKLVAATGDGQRKRSTPASRTHRVVSPQTALEMRAMLARVVESGTGQEAAVPGYTVFGKTGTARIPQGDGGDPEDGYKDANGQYHYNATFAGGIDGGDLTIIVVINEPTTSSYASETAAPVFARLASYALRSYRIPPPSVSGVEQVDVPEVSDTAKEVNVNAGEASSTSASEQADPSNTDAG